MRKSMRKIMCSLLIVVMCLTSVPLGVLVGLDFGGFNFGATKASAAELAESGSCGANVNYTFDSTTGVLTISGTGDMENYGGLYLYDRYSPFQENSDIKTVVIESGVTSIGWATFLSCYSLTSVTIPDTVTSIGDGAFGACTDLTSVTIPDSVTSIGRYAFYGCTSLTSVTIPDSVTSIDYSAFADCTSLSAVYISDMAAWCNINFSSNFDDNPSTYDSNPLYYAHNLYLNGELVTDLVIPSSVTSIGNYAFYGCNSLTDVTIGNDVTSIGNYAFYGCNSLTGVTIGNDVTNVGDGVFQNCTSLESIVIGSGISSISSDIIDGCASLKKITVDENNKSFSSDSEGVLFNKDKTQLILYPTAKTEMSYEIPDSVTSIGYGAFYGCTFLAKITIPESVTIIGSFAFSKCTNLTIYGYIDSYAIAYAEENKIPFVASCHNHDYNDVVTAPTCTEQGYTTHTCNNCGDNFIDTYVNATDHTLAKWTYDWEKSVRTRKCLYCDYTETEYLETTEKGDTEIIAPVDPDTDFNVDEVKPGSDNYIMVEESFNHHGPESFEIIKAFDITMTGKDGVHTQPDGTVKVKIPGDWSKHGVYKVYRVNDDGTLTDMHAYRQGSHLVFDTDHFSLYVVVDESGSVDAGSDVGGDTGSDTPTDDDKTDFISRLIAFIRKIIETIKGWFKK